jgi:zinc protease
MLVSMQVNDLGSDYLERRNDYIEAVTLADVRRVAERLYHPDALLTVVVGAPAGLEG